jgi:uncharacterized membrane-anchored protein YitT (DUF2179 family)
LSTVERFKSLFAARPVSAEAEPLYPVVKHTLLEDVYAFAIGVSFVALGLVFLKSVGLVTGGVAGIALLISYVVPLPVGVLFILINIPFFLVVGRAMGHVFMLKTLAVNVAIMAATTYAPLTFRLSNVHPLFAALFGGTVCGMGILALARHGAGAGGSGVLALYLQKKQRINAGKTQMTCDVLVLGAALLVLNWQQWLFSLLSAAAINGVLVSYHKPERYIGR